MSPLSPGSPLLWGDHPAFLQRNCPPRFNGPQYRFFSMRDCGRGRGSYNFPQDYYNNKSIYYTNRRNPFQSAPWGGARSNAQKVRKSREPNTNEGGSTSINLYIESAMKQLQDLKEHHKKQRKKTL